MPSFLTQPPSAEALLAIITLMPVLVAWMMGLFSAKQEDMNVITVGNPLRSDEETFEHDPAHDCVLHLSRTGTVAELRDLALGLRNAPVEKAAPLLRHFMESTDPELALFSQSMLQQGREKLQATCSQLQNHHAQTDPRIAAALLETNLRLSAPTLAAAGERESRIAQLAKKASEILAACEHTPRLLTAAARVFLAAGDAEKANSLVQSMPANSALRSALEPEVRFALNIHQTAAAC